MSGEITDKRRIPVLYAKAHSHPAAAAGACIFDCAFASAVCLGRWRTGTPQSSQTIHALYPPAAWSIASRPDSRS
jgi:hypothetical protein